MADGMLFDGPAPQSQCAHVNAHYKLETHGSIDIDSTYAPGIDRVTETDRKTHFSGALSFHCQDCNKRERYTGSTIPKFVKKRLAKAGIWDETSGGHIVGVGDAPPVLQYMGVVGES